MYRRLIKAKLLVVQVWLRTSDIPLKCQTNTTERPVRSIRLRNCRGGRAFETQVGEVFPCVSLLSFRVSKGS